MARRAMLIDVRRCTGCQACTVACKAENDVPLGVFRTHVRVYETGKWPTPGRDRLPHICFHCEKPPCVDVCPTGASTRRADGVVFVDYEACIGCRACMGACPYGARFMHPEKRVADKCSFCMHRIDSGIAPACTNTCQGGARLFGDLDDPDSEVTVTLAAARSLPGTVVLRPRAGTRPQVFYIGATFLDEVGIDSGGPQA